MEQTNKETQRRDTTMYFTCKECQHKKNCKLTYDNESRRMVRCTDFKHEK